jgi:hypothetical protein
MAWNSQYALDGFFLFGAPLNVTRYVIDPADNKFGQSTDTCWVARFELDDEIDVIARHERSLETVDHLSCRLLAASVIRLGRTRMGDGTEVLQGVDLLARWEFFRSAKSRSYRWSTNAFTRL